MSRPTIKYGSKGEDVRYLQRILNLDVDGIFGKHTEAAVKAFQKAHGLAVDGIVGKNTWAALEQATTTSVDPSVIYDPLKECITKDNRNIKYLAIHYTAGTTSKAGTAKAMKSSWEKTKNASADFGVDDRDLVQFNPNPPAFYCWAVGGSKKAGATLHGIATNRNTISIEICSSLKPFKPTTTDKAKAEKQRKTYINTPNHDGWYFTEAALDNAVKLAKILMKKYNIPIERVVRHYDITGKLCPAIIGWNNGYIYNTDGTRTNKKNNSEKWLAFKARLNDNN